MAEMAVSLAVDHLLPLLKGEANLLKGIHKEFADIKDELESIQAFLKDADRRAVAEGENTDEGVKTWVKQAREAAFRIEDIIDEYLIYVGKKPHDPGCVVSLNKIAHLIKTLIPRHRIASEIRDIKSHVRGIRERSETYSFERGSSSSGGSQNVKWHDPRIASLFVEEAELVGFEKPRDKLIGLLVEGPEERTVISVVGMGGQGKTTLANRVFNNPKVTCHFDFQAWITVSQSYSVDELLRNLLQKLGTEKEETIEMDQEALIKETRNCLQQKRYVVVFDDVWNPHFWDVIQFALLDNKNGSRILITTRKEDVAMSCKKFSSVHVHMLEPLSHEKSLELFYKKTFQHDFNGRCPDDLVEISCEIVEKCKGLPLAIVCIGGLLCSKGISTALEWKRFCNNLSSELGNNSSINKILGFSYDDLPYYLKPCLLYFGMYPEDYAVRSKRLIRQWIAEGFVKYEKGKTLEEVGQQYLRELVGRSLVQARSFTIDGKVSVCQVHDLTREMILEKCKYLRFCEYIGEDSELVSSGGITRRQSLKTTSYVSMENIEGSHVRTLFFFFSDIKPIFSTSWVEELPKKYKLLKVLHFETAYKWFFFPKSLGNFMHLKYLSFEYLPIDSLPKSIGNLQNLESLNISGTLIRILPKEIYKLRKLRYLSGTLLKLIQMKDGIEGMTSLQTLKKVSITYDDRFELITRELEKLRQLRSLSLIDIATEHENALCSLLNQMQHLEELCIGFGLFFGGVIDLSLVSSPPKFLWKLRLELKLNKLPEWVQELPNLAKLTLRWCELIEDPLKSLKNLQNLMYLDIGFEAYVGESLHFQGEFQNLKELNLSRLDNLNSIVIEKGAMSSLERLTFYSLFLLKTVPIGIHNLEKLQVFQVEGEMSAEFLDNIAPDGGQDRWIIQHVPYVSIDAQVMETKP
ncbi:disease resistance protein RPM1-like [Abrus precatorius]|uniref:Disease resistance protein RPM1-like n=1 Tax=Abrus precatorius TaxID=3816 RepID=A0A8B8KJ30_ABRPR|nr:disease resistance protein RPM1-like [Abrus precatorius]XP_027343837.1 disease resistance protein RPM1-like [Abrus precatorius]XP_027343838.1 disease resistance protein RPM1-like [Abrus precatorius]